MKNINPKRTRVKTNISYLFFILLVLAVLVYGLFIYYPEKILSNTLAEFEKEFRHREMNAVSLLISPDSILQKIVSNEKQANYIHLAFLKFQEETIIVKTRPVLLNNHLAIRGFTKKRAKIDGKYREFGLAVIVLEGNTWKIRQFSFPDAIDY